MAMLYETSLLTTKPILKKKQSPHISGDFCEGYSVHTTLAELGGETQRTFQNVFSSTLG